MRNRWEESSRDDLDAPTTISERQLRRLKRGSRAGVVALLLALVATIASAWSLVMDSPSLSRIRGIEAVRAEVYGALGGAGPSDEVVAEGAGPTNHRTPAPTATSDSSRVGDSAAPAR